MRLVLDTSGGFDRAQAVVLGEQGLKVADQQLSVVLNTEMQDVKMPDVNFVEI